MTRITFERRVWKVLSGHTSIGDVGSPIDGPNVILMHGGGQIRRRAPAARGLIHRHSPAARWRAPNAGQRKVAAMPAGALASAGAAALIAWLWRRQR